MQIGGSWLNGDDAGSDFDLLLTTHRLWLIGHRAGASQFRSDFTRARAHAHAHAHTRHSHILYPSRMCSILLRLLSVFLLVKLIEKNWIVEKPLIINHCL